MPDGGLAVRSANAQAMLGELPAQGERLDERHLSALLRAEIGSALQAFDSVLGSLTAELRTRCFDVIMHQADGLLVVEFEEREAASDKLETFALRAQKSIARIQRQRSIEQLLVVAVEEIARLSGFDRVMAYRFLHDDSGEVVAEHRRPDLPPYLGQRYPASDIPRQARRLYVLSPIRLIADVGYQPVPLVPEIAPHTRAPLDLSESMLRSVSPVHIEYLMNMGVAASMSISIVVKGRLWGLFACHQTTPYLVPHAVRMSCQVLSQIVGMLVDRNLTAQHAAALQRSLALRDVILQQFERNDDIVLALAENPTPFRQLLSSDGAAASAEGALHISGAGPEREALGALIEWLDETDQPDIFHTASLPRDVPHLADRFGAVCGVLALRFRSRAERLCLLVPQGTGDGRALGRPAAQGNFPWPAGAAPDAARLLRGMEGNRARPEPAVGTQRHRHCLRAARRAAGRLDGQGQRPAPRARDADGDAGARPARPAAGHHDCRADAGPEQQRWRRP